MQYIKKKLHGIFFVIVLALGVSMPLYVYAAQPEPEQSVSVQLPLSCVGEHTTEVFRYVLASENTEYQIIEADALSLKDGENSFFVVSYTYPGIYHYTAYQIKGADKDTTYDSTVYTIDVYVTENEQGMLAAEPVIYIKGDSAKKAGMQFVNTKELPANPPAQTTTSKTATAKTGDRSQPAMWLLFVCVSGLFAVRWYMMRIGRKKEDSRDA